MKIADPFDIAVGRWLSAALENPSVCDAMKTDISEWFESFDSYTERVTKEAADEIIQALEEIKRNIDEVNPSE